MINGLEWWEWNWYVITPGLVLALIWTAYAIKPWGNDPAKPVSKPEMPEFEDDKPWPIFPKLQSPLQTAECKRFKHRRFMEKNYPGYYAENYSSFQKPKQTLELPRAVRTKDVVKV